MTQARYTAIWCAGLLTVGGWIGVVISKVEFVAFHYTGGGSYHALGRFALARASSLKGGLI